MPGKSPKLLIAALCLLALCSAANGQQQAAGVKKQSATTQALNLSGQAAGVKKQSTTTQVLNMTGKAAVIIVGQTAKAAWKTTKFTAAEVGKPAAKAIFLKAAPKMTIWAAKLTGKAFEKALPIGKKLFITYLKTRLSI
jgi:hypothetical protein